MLRKRKLYSKIAYTLLKTPKSLQQINDTDPSKKRRKEWFADSSNNRGAINA